MIYYSSSVLYEPHMTFVGRWSPFHRGHVAMIQKKRREHPGLPILIMIRDTNTDAYPATIRAEYIKIWMVEHNIRGTIMIIPNVEGVYWGRGVGYNVGEIDVDVDIKKISGTNIRNDMAKTAPGWERLVAHPRASYVLSRMTSDILAQGKVLWFTGCPASGKTTIATSLINELHKQYPYLKTQLLDGDDMRANPLAQHAGFSKEDRAAHIMRMAYLAKMFADQGILVICAFVSPDRAIRNRAERIIGKNRFIEIYVQTSLRNRMHRDIKGLYSKAKDGKIPNLTGFNAPYEAPFLPDIVCVNNTIPITTHVQRILTYLTK